MALVKNKEVIDWFSKFGTIDFAIVKAEVIRKKILKNSKKKRNYEFTR